MKITRKNFLRLMGASALAAGAGKSGEGHRLRQAHPALRRACSAVPASAGAWPSISPSARKGCDAIAFTPAAGA